MAEVEPSGELNDPRVYFAAERTLLAWVRTSLALMGLGFVVARFGLFLRLSGGTEGVSGLANSRVHGGFSTAIGVALVLLAVGMTTSGSIQYGRFLRTLRPNERPRHYSPLFGILYASALAMVGLLLAVSLLVWSR